MSTDPLMLSLDTVIAASPLLGHKLEDRSRVRNAHDPRLAQALQRASTVPLADAARQALFLVAPLDILVTEADGEKCFHVTETNGTGLGGLTNLPMEVIVAVLSGLTGMARALPEPDALVLVAASGLESSRHPRHNHTIHEKLLYAEALRRGFAARGDAGRVLAMPALAEGPTPLQADGPAVVVGYIKQFLNELRLEAGGRLTLFGRPVTA